MNNFSFKKINNKIIVASLLFTTLLITGCSTGSGHAIDDHQHQYVVEKGVDATCTTDGTTSKVYCSECGYVLADHDVIKAYGHSVVEIPEKEGGIQWEGNNTYYCCEKCGEVLSDKEIRRILVKNEVWSHTHDNTIDFKLMFHRNELNHNTKITVEHLDVKESFELENEDQFTYEDMLNDTLYTFTFDTQYENGDYENKMVLSRYINTMDANLPVINIETKDYEWPSHRPVYPPPGCIGATQTDNNYVYCSFHLNNADGSTIYHSSTTSETNYTARIKTRGNTSSFGEKSPYKIKLAEKKDLLSVPLSRSGKQYESKEWLLLSDSGFKTQLGFFLNYDLTQKNQLNGTHVNLYVNGDYRGVYLLAESVQKGNVKNNKQGRVQIDDDGFIFEDDAYWWNEDVHFDTGLINVLTKYTFKYPDSDEVTADQISYIQGVMNSFEAALLKDDDSYADHIDVDSFVKWLLTHDLLGTWDSGGSNMYLIKKDSADSKVEMGPCWDFDTIFRMPITEHCRAIREYFLYYWLLMKKQSFVERYVSIFDEYKNTVLDDCVDYFDSLDKNSIEADNQVNDYRWRCQTISLDSFISDMSNYLSQKISWLDSEMH